MTRRGLCALYVYSFSDDLAAWNQRLVDREGALNLTDKSLVDKNIDLCRESVPFDETPRRTTMCVSFCREEELETEEKAFARKKANFAVVRKIYVQKRNDSIKRRRKRMDVMEKEMDET